MLYLLNIFNDISNFGNKVYDNVFGFMENLPGFVKGLLTVIILFFVALGALSLLKKSMKAIAIAILIVLAIVGIMMFL